MLEGRGGKGGQKQPLHEAHYIDIYRRYGDMEVCRMGMADMHFLIISASQFS